MMIYQRLTHLSKFNLALKTVDILGQITKKHWGELDLYLNMVANGQEEIAEHIKRKTYQR